MPHLSPFWEETVYMEEEEEKGASRDLLSRQEKERNKTNT
jgi:hypothetical protein